MKLAIFSYLFLYEIKLLLESYIIHYLHTYTCAEYKKRKVIVKIKYIFTSDIIVLIQQADLVFVIFILLTLMLNILRI